MHDPGCAAARRHRHLIKANSENFNEAALLPMTTRPRSVNKHQVNSPAMSMGWVDSSLARAESRIGFHALERLTRGSRAITCSSSFSGVGTDHIADVFIQEGADRWRHANRDQIRDAGFAGQDGLMFQHVWNCEYDSSCQRELLALQD